MHSGVNDKYLAMWNDPEVGRRIDESIERHRKSDATLTLRDRGGSPIVGRRVIVEQTSSPFLFGANLFMAGWYQGEAGRKFERAYAELFNAGTVALYWRDLEPTPGQLRFAPGSVPIRRRPPVDVAIDFGRRNRLNLSGHPLVWDFRKWSVPDWLGDNACRDAAVWERRIAQIADHYGQAIQRWDVVNETLETPDRLANGASRPMPPDYERESFRWAEAHLPRSAFLMINETTHAWWSKRAEYLQLVQRLIHEGARIDGIGYQFHYFADEGIRRIARGEECEPGTMLAALDDAAAFGRPIHISEITLPSPRGDVDGTEVQATVAANFYRLWFSHPAVHAITWWNFPDGAAAPGEDFVDSGLLDPNLDPKPAYRALHDLIRQQWRTRLELTTDVAGTVRFRGFHGEYRARTDQGSATFRLGSQGGEIAVVMHS